MDVDILNSGKIADFYHMDENTLGEGMNKVVRGVNLKSGVEVAIKIINVKEMGTDEQNYLFKEIQILSEVSHPNIVKLLEVFEDTKQGLFYLVLELMKGGTLSEKVAIMQYMCEEKVAQLLMPVIDAVNFCHEIGITHRDLKVILFFF
jgi:serine/threonine protein kinase